MVRFEMVIALEAAQSIIVTEAVNEFPQHLYRWII